MKFFVKIYVWVYKYTLNIYAIKNTFADFCRNSNELFKAIWTLEYKYLEQLLLGFIMVFFELYWNIYTYKYVCNFYFIWEKNFSHDRNFRNLPVSDGNRVGSRLKYSNFQTRTELSVAFCLINKELNYYIQIITNNLS